MQHEWEVTEPDAEMQIRKWQRPSSVSHCFSVPGSFPEGPPVRNKKGTESSSSGFSDYLLAARANRGLTQSKAISFGYYLIRGEWLTGHSPRWTWRQPFALIRWGGAGGHSLLLVFPTTNRLDLSDVDHEGGLLHWLLGLPGLRRTTPCAFWLSCHARTAPMSPPPDS